MANGKKYNLNGVIKAGSEVMSMKMVIARWLKNTEDFCVTDNGLGSEVYVPAADPYQLEGKTHAHTPVPLIWCTEADGSDGKKDGILHKGSVVQIGPLKVDEVDTKSNQFRVDTHWFRPDGFGVLVK
mgnify:CR=1 FL=1